MEPIYRACARCASRKSIALKFLYLLSFVAVLLSGGISRAGLVFNVSYDSSTASAPSGFKTEFNDVIQFFESTYNDPITINMNVGWGEINGNPLSPGDLGQSLTNQVGFYNYSQVRTALINDATSAADAQAVSTLPVADPTGGLPFAMSNAEGKSLGLLAGNASGTDGWVGFYSSASYTFDPNNRAVSGEYDFYGLAAHEITEVMGRYGVGQNGAASGRLSPIDLFRWFGNGVRDLTPGNGDYFSIDGGATVINTYNGTGGGDLSDWAGATKDSFDASLSPGSVFPVSAGDVMLMDVLGYNLTNVPEPVSVSAIAVGMASLLMRRKRAGAAA